MGSGLYKETNLLFKESSESPKIHLYGLELPHPWIPELRPRTAYFTDTGRSEVFVRPEQVIFVAGIEDRIDYFKTHVFPVVVSDLIVHFPKSLSVRCKS